MADETACICPYTDPSMWLSAASCGYGSGYEPGSMQEWNPDCPAHPPTPVADETNAGGLTDELLAVILAASPGTPTLTCRKIADAVDNLIAAREVEAGRQALRDAAKALGPGPTMPVLHERESCDWWGEQRVSNWLTARADGLGGAQ